jgi:hypothetical protein
MRGSRLDITGGDAMRRMGMRDGGTDETASAAESDTTGEDIAAEAGAGTEDESDHERGGRM